MSALKTIADRAAEKNLPFLVSGGYAVIAHGYPRKTFDLDIIVRRRDARRWQELASELGYVFYHQGPVFFQFNHSDMQHQPLDMMLANDEIFDKLAAEAVPAPPGAGNAKIVTLPHLIALKCHAVKNGHPGRIVKDTDDVLRLIQANRLDPESPEIQAIFVKYGTTEFYEQVRNSCKKKP